MTNVCDDKSLIMLASPKRPARISVGLAPLLLSALLVLTACGATALLSGCAGKGKPLYEPGVLRANLGTEPPGLDWHTATDSTSFDVISNLMIGLTAYTNDLKCVPSCAESWDVLDGGKRFVFHIRKNLIWADGKPLTAYDFEYAWKRLLDPNTAAQYAFFLYDIVGAREFNTGKDIKGVAISATNPAPPLGIKAIDAATFEVKLNKPAAYFIYLTSVCASFPMRKDMIEKYGDRWTEPGNLISNGPFKLSKWQHEYKMELTANENFWQGPPKLKAIKMFMVPEQSTAYALYENNELDFIDNRSLATPDIERIKHSPEYKNFPLLRSNYLAFNCKKPPFTDARVRRAVSMAIDRSIFAKILGRNERPANSWIPPALPGYNKANDIPFDPPAARKLLAEAGYPDGKGLPPIEVLYPNRDDVTLTVEAVQDELKRNLSMPIHLENTEWKVYLTRVKKDPPTLFRNNWGADYPDPETFMNLFTSYNGNNHTRWSSPDYDALIESAEAEQDPVKRAALYQKADHIISIEQAPIVPSFMATQNIMVKPWVKGIAINPLDLQFFREVEVGDANASQANPGGNK
ncbi:MAG: peptide ABC transporter substrate-binding protein [Cyanobacteria bacterium REEB67]|nr:peptide ABC transporter substrate-binding protein [Cyanobacteria bacterium REEB67]